MAYQKAFKRYELKYLLTRDQKERVIRAMAPYMTIDDHGRSTIRNIYCDTDDYILARHSIAKPDFKEKLRIRSYSKVTPGDKVFVELKRKFDHVVYKRRIALPEADAMRLAAGSRRSCSAEDSQTVQLGNEINYFLEYYRDLKPVLFLSYEREAYRLRKEYADQEGAAYAGFRVTFDENILCRDHDLSLTSDVYGEPVLRRDRVLMEIKCSGGIPLWMVSILSSEKIYKTSFSKYGTAYTDMILPNLNRTGREYGTIPYAERDAGRAAAVKRPEPKICDMPRRWLPQV